MNTGDTKKECGLILRSLRHERQLSLRELAEKLDMAHAYMGFLENGQRSVPNPQLMARLGKALSTSYEVIEWATKGKRLRPWIDVLSKNPKNSPLIVELSIADQVISQSQLAKLYKALRKEAPEADITLTITRKGGIQGGVLEDPTPVYGEKQQK